jgi:hypothetical protein
MNRFVLNLPLAWVLLATLILASSSLPPAWAQSPHSSGHRDSEVPVFTDDGKLVYPASYREWIYLSSGLDMSYRKETAGSADHHMFNNVFVNPSAYDAFLETGTWPDQTALVLEIRGAGSNASINKAGQFQTGEVMGLEVHVKDKRLPGGWAFYGFDDDKPTTPFPHEMNCYSCHEQHGAVNTTFVQFYPTLVGIAEKKGTLSEAYRKEKGK